MSNEIRSGNGDGSEHWVDAETGAVVINESTIPDSAVYAALNQQHPEVAALVNWGSKIGRQGSIFERDKYLTPVGIFDQMKVAYEAAQQDDVVAGVIETSEALALGRLDFDADEEDEETIWEQIAEDLDLDARLREMWRELFTVSQFYAVTWWGRKTYKVKGRTKSGVKRKKEMTLNVPVGISLLDPLKVMPVGNFHFGQERLAYIANRTEAESIENVLAGRNTTDLFILQLIDRKYEPSESERQHISDAGVDPNLLFLLDDNQVWRHTETRAAYERFASVRMKSVFEILDLKRQLRERDRAHLIGGTNFIVLVKKGSDEYPARPQEINQLAAQVRSSARVPVIVGDHRLDVEIVTPKQDNTLRPEPYNGLDARISARLWGMFLTGNFAAGAKGDDSIKLAKVVGRVLETRRNGLISLMKKRIIKPTQERNEDQLKSVDVDMTFHPRRIALDFDPALAALLQDMRERGEMSRETMHDEMGLEQEREAVNRQREKDKGLDDIFSPIQVPFDSPVKTSTNESDGRTQGGNRNGGGQNPDSNAPATNPTKRTRNTRTGGERT